MPFFQQTKCINTSDNLDLIFDVATGIDVNPGNQLYLGFDLKVKK